MSARCAIDLALFCWCPPKVAVEVKPPIAADLVKKLQDEYCLGEMSSASHTGSTEVADDSCRSHSSTIKETVSFEQLLAERVDDMTTHTVGIYTKRERIE